MPETVCVCVLYFYLIEREGSMGQGGDHDFRVSGVSGP